MFTNNNSQYISVVKYHNQLKFDYKLLNQDEIISSNQSAFLLNNEFIPEDAIFKLNTWQKDVTNTYISTLSNSEDQIIIPKSSSAKNEDFSITSLNATHNIGVKKSLLFEEVHYFDKTGLDFVYSPFHILNLHVDQNPSANNLVVLVLDNHLYLLILNENSEIIYHCIKTLTSFDDIKQTEFYESEVVGQKLFDEVYYFEIQNALQSVIKEFYNSQSEVFIEKIVILYTLKQLNDEQIKFLQDDFMIPMNYHPISIDEFLYELSRDSHISQKSFISPRKKITGSKVSQWLSATVITTALAAGAFYYFQIPQEENKSKKEAVKQEIKFVKKEVKEKTIKSKLPNHIIKNRKIEKKLMSLFDIIPFNVLLKELTLKRDESVLEANFLKDDTYIKTMQPTFLKEYKYSEIKFQDIDATILNATIYNSEYFMKNQAKKVDFPKYIKDEFLPQERVHEQLKAMFPENGIIKFKSVFKSEVTTFNYLVNIIVDTPLEFLEIIEDINKELYSMNISYPVMIRKTIDGVEVEFGLQFHQVN